MKNWQLLRLSKNHPKQQSLHNLTSGPTDNLPQLLFAWKSLCFIDWRKNGQIARALRRCLSKYIWLVFWVGSPHRAIEDKSLHSNTDPQVSVRFNRALGYKVIDTIQLEGLNSNLDTAYHAVLYAEEIRNAMALKDFNFFVSQAVLLMW